MENVVKASGAIIEAAVFPANDKQKLVALVQGGQDAEADDSDVNAQVAANYKTHSTGIFDVIESFEEKAEEEFISFRVAEAMKTKRLRESEVDKTIDMLNESWKQTKEELVQNVQFPEGFRAEGKAKMGLCHAQVDSRTRETSSLADSTEELDDEDAAGVLKSAQKLTRERAGAR